MCVFGIPLTAISNLNGRFLWSFPVCVFQGFIMYLGSMSCMYTLASISIIRYVIVTKPTYSAKVKYQITGPVLLTCYVGGIFWSVLPFSGWTRYDYEKIGTTCGVSLDSKDTKALSYNISIFLCCFLIPVIIMVYCYSHILYKVSLFCYQYHSYFIVYFKSSTSCI